MNIPIIPEEVLQRQREASDPTTSAWVSANAGSGKTHVLAQRVIRLLLAGTDPSKILCLTFTKAAAANMATTVFDTLAKWTTFYGNDLDCRDPHDVERAADRKIAAAGASIVCAGIGNAGRASKVQTIHAFCTRLLQQFPFEANVSARFAVLEDTAQRQLLEQTSITVLLDAATNADSPLARALTVAVTSASDLGFRTALKEAIDERDALTNWIERTGGIEGALSELSNAFGIRATKRRKRSKPSSSPVR